ncbi:MAG: VacJ family lipoprotein [Gammaproteobacteria bacterium]|nr:VacJ family lipoprotein [Gammaproteobacteria bacterium]
MTIHSALRGGSLIGILLLASACASIPPEQRAEHDPWEPLNRPVYKFNTVVDSAITKPLAKGYRKVVPGPVKTGVTNVFVNLTTPRSALNNFLQGKPKRGFSEIGRFLFNSTVGIGGIFDVASASGMDQYREDFGQTAAVWGVGDGPFVMLPILGPNTLRDAILMPLDIASDPVFHIRRSDVRDPVVVLRIIDLRYRLLPTDKLLEDSKDRYLTTRESYLQNREYRIYDGNPPEDDDFYDEYFDEEEEEEEQN